MHRRALIGAAAASGLAAALPRGRLPAAHLAGSAPDPTVASALGLARAIRRRELSAVEAVEACLRRIEAVNPALNAVVAVDPDAARRAARAADAALARGAAPGPLHGVPCTIKDSFDTAGLVSAAGTPGRKGHVPAANATVVGRLRAAGAIVLGKTNTPELTAGAETDNPVYGRTANPYDPARTPGGSSGGAAAIVAAGGAAFDIGSDTSGSIRLPCHFCGVAGLKPTSGRVPRTGHIIGADGILQGLTQPGPIARRVEDLALVLGVIAGADWHDPSVVPMPLTDPAGAELARLRIAYFSDNGIVSPTAEITRAVADAVSALRDAGLAPVEARPDGLLDAYESSFALFTADGGAWLRGVLERAGTGPDQSPLARNLAQARALPAGELSALVSRLDEARSRMTRFLERFDLIVSPVNVEPAVPHGTAPERVYPGLSYTVCYNAAGWPAGTVRVGATAGGLPIGVQVAAAPWREDAVVALLQLLEDRFGGWRPPDLSALATRRP